MAFDIKGLERKFVFQKSGQGITLSDPDPSISAEAVMSFFSNIHPELTTATVQGPEIKDDYAVYTFKTTVGTKG